MPAPRVAATLSLAGLVLIGCATAAEVTSNGARRIVAEVPGESSAGSTDGSGAGADPAGDDPPSSDPASADPSTGAADDTGDGLGDGLFPSAGNPGVDVQHYDVQIEYDPATDRVAGMVGLDLVVTDARDRITLDVGPDLTISELLVDSVGVPVEVRGDELDVPLGAVVAAGTAVRVDVTYEGDPTTTTGAFGLDSGWFDTDGGSYVLNEPDSAKTWLPSNDHPSDKATWTFEVTVPEGLTAVANGVLVEHRTDDDHEVWIWDQVDPMATYLVQLLTGDYEIIEGDPVGDTRVVHVALRDDVERMQPYFAVAGDMVRFFEPLFGPYPLSTYGTAFTDSFSGLAMETQGRPMFAREDFSGQLGLGESVFLSHELSHQWFGDAVSPARWRDIWLAESFATYGQWLWLDGVGAQDLETTARAALVRRALVRGSTASPAKEEMFGFLVYDGGALVLHALRLALGDDAFFSTLQSWVSENTGTSRTTEDFVEHVETKNPDLDERFFEEWLYAESVPIELPG